MAGTINLTVATDPTPDTLTVQVPGIQGAPGIQGTPGQANVLTIGAVTTGAPGSSAVATISGVSPNQVLNLTIPQGSVGATGAAGQPNTLTIGTVNTVNATTGGSATITGTAPNQVLNLVLPRGYGVIPAGAAGDVLVKNSATDYDTKWSTPTSAATPSVLVERDAAGRAQVVDPSVAADISTKNYVDTTAVGPMVKVIRNVTTQSIPNAVFTAIVWDTVIFDTNGMYTSGSANLTVKKDGYYSVEASVDINSAVAGRRGIRIWQNGVASWIGGMFNGSAAGDMGASCSGLLQCKVNDLITVNFFQDTGGTVPTADQDYMPTTVSMAWIRPL